MTLPSGLASDDFSADIRPQDDLYRHVNGAWLDRTEIPSDKARWGSFMELAEQAEKDVRVIVEEAQQAPEGAEARKVGDIFTSFMDTERIAALGLDPIQDQLAAVDAVTDVSAFLRTVSELDRQGVTNVIGVFIEPDPGNPERYVPFFTQAGISLPDEQYYREDVFAPIREAFVQHVERMLTLAKIAEPAESAMRIMDLETRVASHHWDNVKSRDAVAGYNLMTWDAVQELAGRDLAPWRDAILEGVAADAFAEVNVMQPSFLTGLGSLLTEENLDDWKTWLRWKIVRSAAPYLTDDLIEENFSFVGTTLQGVPEMRGRWKRGVSLAEGALGDVIGKAYVERHFPPAAKAQMDELVTNVVEAYRESITNLEWMTPATREKALAKLDTFVPKIGYPVKWIDYSRLEIDPTDLVGNVRRAAEFGHHRELSKIGKPIDRDEWFMSPQTVNAYYNPLMNEIVFPAAILQYPFFDPNRDAAANYGGIGAVIGHEIGHGFDDQGSQYDGSGALNNWWTDEDRAAFEERTGALIAQYNALSPKALGEEHTVNGALTIGENIGDLGGLSIALKAYERSLDGAESPVIDGYTGTQRVFLSYAQVWQLAIRDAEAIRLLTVDPHSPNEFRANQIARNVDAFYEAFGVTEGDELWLPRDQRVSIW
ncbi:zinc metalloprotease [Microbacterium nanhaiense]|uniref:Zinc metalloprotease n=1 Tax=Microbacterium nanhaiense TaxID=1301026 RepID=A0ABQ2N461_9MICO|nr:M13-type metalloendopeptidase [Microbacterium nanhaiense]GGO66407.1 zinc metalloprotease [Microbacterium nanhaiense]